MLGELTENLKAAPAHLIDLNNALTVALGNEAMTLLSVSDDELWAGANLAMVGDELLQFADAQRVAPGRWRLTRLLRGRRGSNIAEGHDAGARFVLLDRAQLTPLTVPAGVDAVSVFAKGVGDPAGVTVSLSAPGRALCPLPPVHARASIDPDGALNISWIRQSREGWTWRDGIDVPLAEEAELYRVTVTGASSGHVVERVTNVPNMRLSQTDLQGFRAAGDIRLNIAIRQAGRFAVSPAADLSVLL